MSSSIYETHNDITIMSITDGGDNSAPLDCNFPLKNEEFNVTSADLRGVSLNSVSFWRVGIHYVTLLKHLCPKYCGIHSSSIAFS